MSMFMKSSVFWYCITISFYSSVSFDFAKVNGSE